MSPARTRTSNGTEDANKIPSRPRQRTEIPEFGIVDAPQTPALADEHRLDSIANALRELNGQQYLSFQVADRPAAERLRNRLKPAMASRGLEIASSVGTNENGNVLYVRVRQRPASQRSQNAEGEVAAAYEESAQEPAEAL